MKLDLAHLSEADNILLNQVAEEIRKPYNELVTRLSEAHRSNIDWIVGSIASRSIFLSPLVWHCYHLGFLRRRLEQGGIAEIIVHDKTLAGVVKAFVRGAYPGIRVTCAQSTKQRVKAAIKPFYQFTLAARLFGIYTAARRTPPAGPLPLHEPVTLVDTFVLENSFANGDYNDRYYPGMRDALDDRERDNLYYVPTFIGISGRFGDVIKKIRVSSFRFLLKEDVLEPADYRFAFAHFLRMRALRRFENIDFLGFDVAPLVNRELASTAWDPSSVLALLIYRFVRRLKERGVQLRYVVDWFENQVIDRAFHRGLREFYPEVPTTGYAGYIVSPVYNFYMHPTDFEHTSGIVPKELSVIGTGHVESVREFCSSLNVGVAPAFRFNGVWREKQFHPDESEHSVLIALPITLKDSMEILQAVMPFCERSGNGVRFRVKAHPSVSKEAIEQRLGAALPAAMEFVEGDFNTWVERSHVLVGNSSSTCVEALAKGIPVVIIGSRSGITQNPVPDNIAEDIWSLCYTSEEVARALERYLERDEQTRRRHEDVGKRIRAEYFEPVTRESSRRFLKIEETGDRRPETGG